MNRSTAQVDSCWIVMVFIEEGECAAERSSSPRARDDDADCGNDSGVGKIARKINDFYSLNCIYTD